MNESTFPHHSGGVVQVQHFARYGAVPESLLEDNRLDLDSRAVAAWLAVKPAGWQISIKNLRLRLARVDKTMLGKDRWQRIAHELESAGYLSRKKVNGKGGQWVWHIIFNPVPASWTVVGSAGYGPAERGAPTDGLAGAGIHGHKELPSSESPPNRPTTTNEPLAANLSSERKSGSSHGKSSGVQELHYPEVTPDELKELKNLMRLCHIDFRQDVLDEIEGIRKTGGITRGAIPLTKALIKKVAAGKFSLSAGFSVRVQRETRRRNEQAISIATAIANFPLSISEEDIAKLPPNLAKRAREAAARSSSLDAQGQQKGLSNPST